MSTITCEICRFTFDKGVYGVKLNQDLYGEGCFVCCDCCEEIEKSQREWVNED